MCFNKYEEIIYVKCWFLFILYFFYIRKGVCYYNEYCMIYWYFEGFEGWFYYLVIKCLNYVFFIRYLLNVVFIYIGRWCGVLIVVYVGWNV